MRSPEPLYGPARESRNRRLGSGVLDSGPAHADRALETPPTGQGLSRRTARASKAKSLLGLTLIVIALVIGSKLLLENALGIDTDAAAIAWLENAGPVSALLIVGLLAADVFLPVPSSMVMVLSGAAFGVAQGALLALAGSVLGEWLGFELVRRYGRRTALRMVGEDDLARFSRFFERYGAAAVVVTRPLPIVMETMSVVAGLAGMRRRTFLVASVAGTLPIAVVYAYAGSASREMGNLLPAVVILVALGAAGWLVGRRKEEGGRRKEEGGRRKKEGGRRKKEEGRRKKIEDRR